MRDRAVHVLVLVMIAVAPLTAQRVAHHDTQTAHADSTPRAVPNLGWRNLAIGSGVLVATVLADGPIAHYFDGPHSPAATNAAHTFNHFGDATGVGVVLGGLGVASLVTRDHRVVQVLLRTATGFAIAAGATNVLKFATGRQRPFADPDRDGLDFYVGQGTSSASPSFPSGHTSTAFALATSLGDAANRTWVRVGLYGLATCTAWARLQQEQHWVTDVVSGAAVGILSAKFADGRVRIMGMRAPHFLFSNRGAGLQWTLPMPQIR